MSPSLFAVTSGWDGPFQLAEVLVVADDDEQALVAAERAFADVSQPVCRARMRLATLGPADGGPVTAPRTADGAYRHEWRDPERRCDPPALSGS